MDLSSSPSPSTLVLLASVASAVWQAAAFVTLRTTLRAVQPPMPMSAVVVGLLLALGVAVAAHMTATNAVQAWAEPRRFGVFGLLASALLVAGAVALWRRPSWRFLIQDPERGRALDGAVAQRLAVLAGLALMLLAASGVLRAGLDDAPVAWPPLLLALALPGALALPATAIAISAELAVEWLVPVLPNGLTSLAVAAAAVALAPLIEPLNALGDDAA